MYRRLSPWMLTLAALFGMSADGPGQETRARFGPIVAAQVQSEVPKTLSLDDLIQMSLAQNPALAQAGLNIEAARGDVRQAQLYPNPTVTVSGEEMNRQGGIITAPMVSQEIITAGKRRLDMAIASKKYDQATIGLIRQRFMLISAVRQGYFEVLTAQQRVSTLASLEQIAKNSYENTQRLLDAKQVALLDSLQVQLELNRVQADLEASKREQTAAWRRLTSTMGLPQLAETILAGSLEAPLPNYDFETSKAYVIERHPEVGVALVGVDHANLTLKRNEAQAIPNVTVGAGFMRNNNEREDQWRFQVSVPLPLFNRNQGKILTARADVDRSVQEVSRVQNDLVNRLATAFGTYAAAKERVEKYRKSILPIAQQANKIAFDAYKGGQFEYLRVLQSQRALQEANLEYVRSLGEAWRSAAEISALLLQEDLATPAAIQKK